MKLLRRHRLPYAAFVLGAKNRANEQSKRKKGRENKQSMFHKDCAARLSATASRSRRVFSSCSCSYSCSYFMILLDECDGTRIQGQEPDLRPTLASVDRRSLSRPVIFTVLRVNSNPRWFDELFSTFGNHSVGLFYQPRRSRQAASASPRLIPHRWSSFS